MRKFNQIVSTGAFFLCLGGWVYSGQLSAAEEVSQARGVALNAAVAQAAAPTVLGEGTMLAQANTTPPAPAPAATTTAPAPNTELKEPTVAVGVDGKVEQISVQNLEIESVLHLLSIQMHKNIIASKDRQGDGFGQSLQRDAH